MAEATVAVRVGGQILQISADHVDDYLQANPGAERVEEPEDEEPRGKGKKGAK